MTSPQITANAAPARLALSAEGTSSDPFSPADWGLLAFMAIVWGASYLLIAEGIETMAPGLVAFLRLLLGLTVLTMMGRPWQTAVRRSDLPRVAVLGLVWFAIPFTLFPIAEQWIPSAVAGMLNGALPIFAATFAALVLRRPPGRNQLWGLAIGVIGVVCIGLPAVERGSHTAAGVALVLVAMASYAVAGNLVVPLQQRYGSVAVIWRAQAVALVLTTPYAAVGAGDSSFTWRSLAAVAALGALGTGLAFVVAATLMGRVGGTRGGVVAYLIPVVALLAGVAVRGESIAPLAIVGLGFTLVAAWLLSRRGR